MYLMMSANKAEFITDLVVLDVTEGRDTKTLRLLEPFRVYSGVLDAVIQVPAGFECDSESVPLFIQWLAPPFGYSKRAAIVHDLLYRRRGYLDANGAFHPVTRKQADDVYHELCEAKGLPTWRSNVRWAVLRLVGWKAWNDDARLIEKAQPPTVRL